MKALGRWFTGCLLLVLAHAVAADQHADKAGAIARGWIEAAFKGQAEFRAYVDQHMAADGTWNNDRYVGLGFYFDPDNKEEVIVQAVMPGTPAASVLQPGDKFVSVGGVAVTSDNRESLNIRGAPGKPVVAVIERDGKASEIQVARGIIDRQLDKAEVLAFIDLGDADEWPVDAGQVLEVMSKGNVVYVLSEFSDTEADTGNPFKAKSVARFEFNDKLQVVNSWRLSEDRFVLEQQGYTITR